MTRLHDDQVPVDGGLARTLVDGQFPQWADLRILPIDSGGTDNAVFRLGDRLALRIPTTPAASTRLDKEHAWLPAIGPLLPLPTPEPVARGRPGPGMPFEWSVYRWIEGTPASPERLANPLETATELGGFVRAIHEIDPTDGPAPGPHNSGRGVPLSHRDAATRDAIERLRGHVDVAAVTSAWERALSAPRWSAPGVWIHGDLWETNLLLDDAGRLVAVIDFGCLGVGDPATDLSVAWNLFSGSARAAFRDASAVDDSTWARGRGWALSFALIALPYYLDTNPVIVANARRMIDAVLDDS